MNAGRFELISEFTPTGDQPQAIEELVNGILRGDRYQILLGVTGSGKTFTIANVIARVQKPTLVISHNKTLAAQLYAEFKSFFPHNAVEYFVSYYDYYQPEAYIPSKNLYIEKDLSINEEIEKFRLSTISSLMSGRRDVIVVASVSCIYGLGNPSEFSSQIRFFQVGDQIGRDEFLEYLVNVLYNRSDSQVKYGTFRVKGDVVELFPGFGIHKFKIYFLGNTIEMIEAYDMVTGNFIEERQSIVIYPANIFVAGRSSLPAIIERIREDLERQVAYFMHIGKLEEAQRLQERVSYDMEMLQELGYCQGIENYSRYFDGREPGQRPFCLLDYFPEDYLLIIDESHVTIPQIRGMYGGDRSRKQILVDYGFRLPAAMDNRPLTFQEFESIAGQTIYVSATPGDYEFMKTGGVFVEQVIRPTGLLEPEVIVRPIENQIDDLLNEIRINIQRNERTLITTLTKRMAEELTKFFIQMRLKARYIHADVDTVERVKILEELRNGDIDIVVGVNLLREGLDLPEVSLVAILDADKEGFLRSDKSLIQTAGRAARNVNSRVILYANHITGSMQRMIDETNRRRQKQLRYNQEHNITPQTVKKQMKYSIAGTSMSAAYTNVKAYPETGAAIDVVFDPISEYLTQEKLKKLIQETERKMKQAAKKLDFIQAAAYRDELFKLRELLKTKLQIK